MQCMSAPAHMPSPLSVYLPLCGWMLQINTVGYEPYALQGAQRLLKECTVYVVYTQLYQGPGGLNVKANIRWAITGMAKLGYKLKAIHKPELHKSRAEYTINQYYQVRCEQQAFL